MAPDGSRRPSFLPIGCLAAYDAVGYAVVPPVLPALAERAGATPLGASLIFATFSLGLVAGFVIAGQAIRKRGLRPTAIGGALLHLIADLLFIFGHTTGVYIAARVAQGLGSGMVWMAAVFAVLSLWPERPEARLGRILAGFAVGSVLGPLLAALGGVVRPFAVDASLAVVGLAAAARFPSAAGRSFGWKLGALRSRRMAFALAMITLEAVVISAIEGSYTLHFATGLSQAGLAALFTILTVSYGLGALLPVATRSIRGSRTSAQVGALVTAAMTVGLLHMTSPPWWFVFAAALGVSLGAMEAGILSLAASAAEGGLLAAMMAYSQAFALGFLVGPPAATWLTSRFSLAVSGWVVVALLVLGAGSGALVPSASPMANAGQGDSPHCSP